MEDDAGCAPDAVSFWTPTKNRRWRRRDAETGGCYAAFLLAAESVLKRGTRRNKKKRKVRVDADAWLKVLYETDDVAAVHKPAGMLTHSRTTAPVSRRRSRMWLSRSSVS